MYQSRYNVFDGAGQVLYAAGDEIDEAEAVRQGIVELPAGQQLVFDGDRAVLEAAADAPANGGNGEADADNAADDENA